VEGRKIIDRIILTNELIHSLHYSKNLGILIKLDLSKSFDILNWNYILIIMAAFGFNEIWIQWIHSLLSMALFSMLVNGFPSPTFSPFICICNGYPLWSFLFILMVEGLGRTIKVEVVIGNQKWISLHGKESPASHQQFLDKNMLVAYPYFDQSLFSMEIKHTGKEECIDELKFR
jgi:hypothetical protein